MAQKSDETPLPGGKKPASFEEALAQLQEIVRELESGEQSLDDSLKLYEQGIASLRTCHTFLDHAEQRIKKLVAGAGGKVNEEPFAVGECSGANEALPADPGGSSSGPTQVLPAISDADGSANLSKPKKPQPPRRGRSGKDSPLFSE